MSSCWQVSSFCKLWGSHCASPKASPKTSWSWTSPGHKHRRQPFHTLVYPPFSWICPGSPTQHVRFLGGSPSDSFCRTWETTGFSSCHVMLAGGCADEKSILGNKAPITTHREDKEDEQGTALMLKARVHAHLGQLQWRESHKGSKWAPLRTGWRPKGEIQTQFWLKTFPGCFYS